MKLANWKPKDDTIAVAVKGVIKAEDFTQEDLDNLVNRAKNRNQDVTTFLIRAGLVPVKGQFEIELSDNTLLNAVKESGTVEVNSNSANSVTVTKRKRRTKAEIEADKK